MDKTLPQEATKVLVAVEIKRVGRHAITSKGCQRDSQPLDLSAASETDRQAISSKGCQQPSACLITPATSQVVL